MVQDAEDERESESESESAKLKPGHGRASPIDSATPKGAAVLRKFIMMCSTPKRAFNDA
jgi:hypothetical protein